MDTDYVDDNANGKVPLPMNLSFISQYEPLFIILVLNSECVLKHTCL